MSQEKEQILEMLADGKISLDDAKALLKAIEKKEAETSTTVTGGTFKRATKTPEFLCVRVQSDAEDSDDSDQVDIRVPIKLLKAGIKLGALMPEKAKQSVDEALSKSGVDFKLSALNEDNLNEVIEALQNLTINVQGGKGKKDRVNIYCE